MDDGYTMPCDVCRHGRILPCVYCQQNEIDRTRPLVAAAMALSREIEDSENGGVSVDASDDPAQEVVNRFLEACRAYEEVEHE